nr:hypothetical protein Itr_chr06CG19630 [Ipomoea trifida]
MFPNLWGKGFAVDGISAILPPCGLNVKATLSSSTIFLNMKSMPSWGIGKRTDSIHVISLQSSFVSPSSGKSSFMVERSVVESPRCASARDGPEQVLPHGFSVKNMTVNVDQFSIDDIIHVVSFLDQTNGFTFSSSLSHCLSSPATFVVQRRTPTQLELPTTGASSISSSRRPLFLPSEHNSDNDGPSYSTVGGGVSDPSMAEKSEKNSSKWSNSLLWVPAVRQLRPVKQSSGSSMATVGSGKRSDGVFYFSLLQGCLVSEEDDVGGRQIR